MSHKKGKKNHNVAEYNCLPISLDEENFKINDRFGSYKNREVPLGEY